ncbi:molybdenum cofactor synthesis domain-containing protein [Agrococcus baldri]|uniref:Molybdenum cofactor synthesis domain-containing protein n=1 Tax=Agrococcus baldri TaxID=153730 RepID=A0AA94L036_9MICO|nr:molybdopterin-binding protein [Agrococcus baldri]SFS15090.1 molybdenum cofactor synthesis domain-containing protein [Agrococcus baldri]
MPNPTAAMLVIGDEILSGRTRDANAYHLAGRLVQVGIDLHEIRVVPDDHAVIVEALRSLSAAFDHVFTSGGIGPTHDDITADAVADAFGVGIDVRDDARALLQAAVGKDRTLTPEHLRMARIPHGADLIANPLSGAPGISIGNVHVMAGVPTIFVAMLDAVLPSLEAGRPVLSRELRFEVGEGRIAAPLRRLAEELSDLSFGSYPFRDGAVYGTNIVVRGTDDALIDQAIERLEAIRRSHP